MTAVVSCDALPVKALHGKFSNAVECDMKKQRKRDLVVRRALISFTADHCSVGDIFQLFAQVFFGTIYAAIKKAGGPQGLSMGRNFPSYRSMLMNLFVWLMHYKYRSKYIPDLKWLVSRARSYLHIPVTKVLGLA
ncbi:hypothetical protein NC653_010016 [Populus alba x Populus x berolinensis]|uniref:Uncharacterized protein n=1 Tax=Populus alba x Populus x berolinensis TaxID=444605 RepID=A0AAD6RAN8_9ROSI|nr:hypothetical protein NC653_010016 [Populus alba x Populus x berolinensis]